jgi:hypothetical protein
LIKSKDKDESLIGKLKAKAYQESMSLMQGIDPTLFISTPRLLTFAAQLAINLKKLVLINLLKIIQILFLIMVFYTLRP